MPEPQKSSPVEEIFNSLPQTNLPETDIVEIPKYLSDTKKILDSFSRKDIPIVSDMENTLNATSVGCRFNEGNGERYLSSSSRDKSSKDISEPRCSRKDFSRLISRNYSGAATSIK